MSLSLHLPTSSLSLSLSCAAKENLSPLPPPTAQYLPSSRCRPPQPSCAVTEEEGQKLQEKEERSHPPQPTCNLLHHCAEKKREEGHKGLLMLLLRFFGHTNKIPNTLSIC